MKKSDISIVKDAKVDNLLDILRKRLDRDEKRFKHFRCVYMYRWKPNYSIDDNVILLDYSTKDAHKSFLENRLYSFIKEHCKSWSFSELKNKSHDVPFAHYEIILVGKLDKLTMKFNKLRRCKVIVDCDSLVFKYFDERKKDEKVLH